MFYDARAFDHAVALTEGWTYADVSALRERVWRDGLRASFQGAPLAATAERLITIAEGGLERRARMGDGKDERVHLARLKDLVARALTPADELTQGLASDVGFRSEVIARVSIVAAAP